MARSTNLKMPFEFYAEVKGADGSSNPVRCYISSPDRDESGISSCFVDCSVIGNKARKIHGQTDDQAIKLAFKFLKNMLDINKLSVIDEHGNPCILPYWNDET